MKKRRSEVEIIRFEEAKENWRRLYAEVKEGKKLKWEKKTHALRVIEASHRAVEARGRELRNTCRREFIRNEAKDKLTDNVMIRKL